MNSYKEIKNQLFKLGDEGLTILKKHKLLEVLTQKILISESLSNYPLDANIEQKLKDKIFEKNGFKSDDEYKIWLSKSNLSEKQWIKLFKQVKFEGDYSFLKF